MVEIELKPVRCGCGDTPNIIYIAPNKVAIGCPKCNICTGKCDICTGLYDTEDEVIQVMGAKDINVPNKFATDTNVGNKTAKFKQDGEFLRCGKCNHIVDSGYKYCPNCGCRLEFK